MERFLRFCILNSCEESLVSSKILPPFPTHKSRCSYGSQHFSAVIFGAANLVGMHNFFLMPLVGDLGLET